MRLDTSTAANQTFKVFSSSETNEGNTLNSTHFQNKLSKEHHSDPPMTLLHSPNKEIKDKRNHSVKKEKKEKSDRKEDKVKEKERKKNKKLKKTDNNQDDEDDYQSEKKQTKEKRHKYNKKVRFQVQVANKRYTFGHSKCTIEYNNDKNVGKPKSILKQMSASFDLPIKAEVSPSSIIDQRLYLIYGHQMDGTSTKEQASTQSSAPFYLEVTTETGGGLSPTASTT